MSTKPNVLVVIADSLRAESVSASAVGTRRETTPFLSAFTTEATTYTQARSHSNWTLPSHASLFTGSSAVATRFDIDTQLAPHQTIFEELAADGYQTSLFTDNPFLIDHQTGLDTTFNTAVGSPETFDVKYATNGTLGDWPNGFWYADQLLSWSADQTTPWAACLNLMDTHRPYEPQTEYDIWSDERIRQIQSEMGFKWHWEFLSGNVSVGFAKLLETIYDGAIRQVDAIFERLIETLRDRGTLDNTLIIITSDHGEAFGAETALSTEPPAVSHRIGTHELLYHVPLFVRMPRTATNISASTPSNGGTVISDLAELAGIPRLIRATVAGNNTTDTDPRRAVCAKDGVTTATQLPIPAGMQREATRICETATPYTKRADIVYSQRSDGTILKQARWGEDAYETLITGQFEREDTGQIALSTVLDAVPSDDETAGISINSINEYDEFAEQYSNEFAEELEDQLEALGYR
ncbi:MAG: arylsulfatase A related enzyme [Haloquadratum walsbyi J07HQW1]|uniref:Arylsulfatase A related enzyme n=1 Tax=Haloquadratum walsbyi J07HQW1 TaxID=1238424 RepID=U1MSM3_9EURY|nr:MAG: arylsulfatase A related enzyme [Haloquadratum walsbyi J07HQW1]